MRGSRGPWTVAAALGALALALALGRRREAPSPPPPPPPAPLETPAPFALAAGRLDGDLAVGRAVLAFPDAVEIVIREESRVAARRRTGRLVLDLREGEVFVDAGGPGAELLVRTPHAEILATGACVNVRTAPEGTSVTVSHGAVTVAGSPFRQEIARDEAIDVSPAGALSGPLRIDPAAAVRWAAEAFEQASRLRHGGFEDGFGDGRPGGGPETPVVLDRRAHAGRHCARVELNTARATPHEGPASGPIELPPGARVRFRGYVQYQDLEGGPGGGFYLDVRDAAGATLARSAVFQGHSGWRKFAVEFTAPASGGPCRVAGRTVDNGGALQGRLRVDDLALFVLEAPPASQIR